MLWSHSWQCWPVSHAAESRFKSSAGKSNQICFVVTAPQRQRAPSLCWQCPQSLQKPWATGFSCKAVQVPIDPGDVSEGHLLCHIASVVGTKGCLSEDLSSSWSHTPCRAHSSLQCATECLEVSHHFIFGDFLMCLFLFFSKQQQRHCCIWQKNKALLFKACALQYQLGQTHHCTLRPPSQKPAGQRVKRLKITN